VALPAIAIYIAGAVVLHWTGLVRRGSRSTRVALRLWMGVCDWVKGIPVGYSFWEQYEAPVMLDEIVVHHDE
jgi:hypothetical protein